MYLQCPSELARKLEHEIKTYRISPGPRRTPSKFQRELPTSGEKLTNARMEPNSPSARVPSLFLGELARTQYFKPVITLNDVAKPWSTIGTVERESLVEAVAHTTLSLGNPKVELMPVPPLASCHASSFDASSLEHMLELAEYEGKYSLYLYNGGFGTFEPPMGIS